MSQQDTLAPYCVERAGDSYGFVVVDGRNERPVALRHLRFTAEALARRLNGEKPHPNDAKALAVPLYNKEFGPNTEEPQCKVR